MVQVFSQERHRHEVSAVMTFARVSTFRLWQNGQCDGLTTASSGMELTQRYGHTP
jgi:hypothetical protein